MPHLRQPGKARLDEERRPGRRHAGGMEQGTPHREDGGSTATLERADPSRRDQGPGLTLSPWTSPWTDVSRSTAVSPGFRVRGSLWRSHRTWLDGGGMSVPGHLHYVRCPRCGLEIAREVLERHWNEWGRVCYRPDLGTFDPACHAFDDRPRCRSTVPDARRRGLRQWGRIEETSP